MRSRRPFQFRPEHRGRGVRRRSVDLPLPGRLAISASTRSSSPSVLRIRSCKRPQGLIGAQGVGLGQRVRIRRVFPLRDAQGGLDPSDERPPRRLR